MAEHQVSLWRVNPRETGFRHRQADSRAICSTSCGSIFLGRWDSRIATRGDRKKFAPPLLYVRTLGQSILSSDTSTQPASHHFGRRAGTAGEKDGQDQEGLVLTALRTSEKRYLPQATRSHSKSHQESVHNNGSFPKQYGKK